MKQVNCILAILLFGLFACHADMKAQRVSPYVISDEKCQTIDGFGASDAWSMWQIGLWEDSVQNKVADWLFSTENYTDGSPKGIGLSIWRYNAGSGSADQGDNAQISRNTRTSLFCDQKGQINFLHHAKDRGVPCLLAFFNTPPVSMTVNGLGTNTGRGGTFNLRDDCYDDFAAYTSDMIQWLDSCHHLHIDYVCPVNEPDAHWNWQGPKQEGTPATNREIARIAREMNRSFVERGISTKILVSESSDYRCMLGLHQTDWQRGNEIQCFWNPDSVDTYVGNLSNIADVMAGHSYWTNTPVLKPGSKGYRWVGLYGYRKQIADAFADKSLKCHGGPVGFWQSEVCIMGNDEEIGGGSPYDFGMDVALYVARIIHYDLTVAGARSWQWWRAAGGNYKDGLLRMYDREKRVRDSKLLWALGNYSRFVRPGAIRLDVKGEQEIDGIMVSAFRNTDGSKVVVIINYGKGERVLGIPLKGKAVAYRTSDAEGENLRNIGTVNSSDIRIPARSILTLCVVE